jgi:hypothetical protein
VNSLQPDRVDGEARRKHNQLAVRNAGPNVSMAERSREVQSASTNSAGVTTYGPRATIASW